MKDDFSSQKVSDLPSGFLWVVISADAELQYLADDFGGAFELNTGNVVARGFVCATVHAFDSYFHDVLVLHGEADETQVDRGALEDRKVATPFKVFDCCTIDDNLQLSGSQCIAAIVGQEDFGFGFAAAIGAFYIADVAQHGFVGIEGHDVFARFAGLIHFFCVSVLQPGYGIQLVVVVDIGQFPTKSVGKVTVSLYITDGST